MVLHREVEHQEVHAIQIAVHIHVERVETSHDKAPSGSIAEREELVKKRAQLSVTVALLSQAVQGSRPWIRCFTTLRRPSQRQQIEGGSFVVRPSALQMR